MRSYEIRFKTLTPIWTGGVDRDSKYPRGTGLIGSLRWWYEGIVRGMGGYACDPTADDSSQRCRFEQQEQETLEAAYNRLCPACRLFGCTGWRRRFRLEVTGLESQELFFVASEKVYTAAGNWLWRMFGGRDLGGTRSGRGTGTTFAFGVRALWGQQAVLRVIPLGDQDEKTLARVIYLLEIITHWGALGAKPQLGFGQVQVLDGLEQPLIEKGKELIKADIAQGNRRNPPDFFNLRYFFSHIYHVQSVNRYLNQTRRIGSPPKDFEYRHYFIPCAFDIRYKSRSKDFRSGAGQDFGMRPWFRQRWGAAAAHRLFGRSNARSDSQRAAGRIHVSHLYRTSLDGPWHLKVWGHVPPDLRDRQGQKISVEDIAEQVDAFVEKMFPGSELIEQFNRQEVLDS